MKKRARDIEPVNVRWNNCKEEQETIQDAVKAAARYHEYGEGRKENVDDDDYNAVGKSLDHVGSILRPN